MDTHSIHPRAGTLAVLLICALCLMLAAPARSASSSDVPPYPNDPEAAKLYYLGHQASVDHQYPDAIGYLRKSIQIEDTAFLTHAHLAAAYFADRQFEQAAQGFSKALELWGGADKAPAFAIMQALSLMKAEKFQAANSLLREWTQSSIQTDGSGAVWSSGGKLFDWWKLAAEYLLGSVAEQRVLTDTGIVEKGFVYLFVAINQTIKGDTQAAEKHFTLTIASTGPGTWRHIIADAELRHMYK